MLNDPSTFAGRDDLYRPKQNGASDISAPPIELRQRYMDPQAGLWLSEDPLEPEEGGDINPRRYVFNNPVNLRDPTGMSPFIQGGTGFDSSSNSGGIDHQAYTSGLGLGWLGAPWGNYVSRIDSPTVNPTANGFTARGGPATLGQHALGGTTSNFVSASTNWRGAAGFEGQLSYIDLDAYDGRVFSNREIRASLNAEATANPNLWSRVDAWKKMQHAESEVLLRSPVPANAVRSAPAVMAQRGVNVASKGLFAYSIGASAYDLTYAAGLSHHLGTSEPLRDEVARQTGGWAGAYALGKGGALVGTALGGPVGGFVGAVIGGGLGFYQGSNAATVLRHARDLMRPPAGSMAAQVPQIKYDMRLYTDSEMQYQRTYNTGEYMKTMDPQRWQQLHDRLSKKPSGIPFRPHIIDWNAGNGRGAVVPVE
ncbi:MAG: RHS repeat-associated core domain-containing protein [Tepidisphaeraceae bacterium]